MPVVAVPIPPDIFSTTRPASRKQDFIDVTFETVIEAPIPDDRRSVAALPAPEEE